jgi:hypothetical protein
VFISTDGSRLVQCHGVLPTPMVKIDDVSGYDRVGMIEIFKAQEKLFGAPKISIIPCFEYRSYRPFLRLSNFDKKLRTRGGCGMIEICVWTIPY